MSQVGVLSMSQLQLHDHYDDSSGGIINVHSRVASATIKIQAPAIRDTAAGVGVFAMMKRILIRENSLGTMDINYTLARVGGAGTVHGQVQIWRAGAAIWTGVDNNTAAGPTVFTDAAIPQDLLAGDCIEIWGYVSAGAAAICRIFDMDVCYTGFITSLSRRVLNAALQLTAAADILYTVIL